MHGVMESESEDEFFDAEDGFKEKRLIPWQLPLESQTATIPECSSSIVVSKEPSTALEEQDEPIQRDCERILLKDKEIAKVQQDCIMSKDSFTSAQVFSTVETADKEPETSREENVTLDYIITGNIVNNSTEKFLIQSSDKKPIVKEKPPQKAVTSSNETKEVTGSDLASQPVAPPRRKRREKRDSAYKAFVASASEKKESVAAHMFDLAKEGSFEVDPFIRVSTSTIEMTQVLEAGNSLEVVFNDDMLSRKSGGSSTSSPKIASASSSNIGNRSTATDAGLVRCNSISGRPLTDEEILQQVGIKNLDTGETIPLSLAKDKLPECTNPLALHIYRIAKDCDDPGESYLEKNDDEDGHLSDTSVMSAGKTQKRQKLKKFFGKTVQKIRLVADEVKGQGRRDETSSDEEDQHDDDGFIKFKNHRAIRDRLMFNKIKVLQDLSGEHIGAVWTMKFSVCGKLLGTAGQDNIVRVWVLKESASHFEEMRQKYSRPTGRQSPTGSMTSSTSTTSAEDDHRMQDLRLAYNDDDSDDGPFRKSPFVSYHGHTSDVLDLSWSKNFFLLSSSMDKTVRLWHISRNECLCCFQHVDFVTAICFHPKDDRYFLSGSLDGKIRLWNIPEKKVALWNEIDGSGTSLITAANFCQNGKLAVVGTYDGRCIFYDTERLKYHTQVTVRSSRGKNSRGRKISGIEPMPGEEKVLITSNDSRIRLYDLKDHSLHCKYKGLQNESSQIKASFSNDGQLILCGSEDKFVHVWRTHHDIPGVRRDRNEYYESFSAHDAVVTAAIFAPSPAVIMGGNRSPESSLVPSSSFDKTEANLKENRKPFEVLVTADWQGGVKLFINR